MIASSIAKALLFLMGLIAALSFVISSPTKVITPPPPQGKTASSTPLVATTTKPIATTTSQIKKPTQKASSTPIVKKPITTAITPPLPKVEPPLLSFDPLNDAARAALVNILCTSKSGGLFNPITGSGVIIDPRGVILTNAHIAQYLLLKDISGKDFIQCIARSGSPAYPRYNVELLYISPRWVEKNAGEILKQEPLGTGENDFALLRITGLIDQSLAPQTSFPYLTPDTENDSMRADDQVLVAAYPAGFLGGIAIETNLYIASTIAHIKEFFTFNEDTLDLFSIGGTVVTQRGSSGGAVVNNKNGKLSGIIVTATDAAQTSERDLRAISLSHINRSFLEETQKSLGDYLNSDLGVTALLFQTTQSKNLIDIYLKVLKQ